MRACGLRLISFFAIFFLLGILPLKKSVACASTGNDSREVRLSHVEGDVRLSRGDGKRVKLNRDWEEAQSGQLIEKGFAVATGTGCAEIEFDNGSTVYLAENSLIYFSELSSQGHRIVTRMTLPTGTAAFWLQPAAEESFFIDTATDGAQFRGPHKFFLRFDAYLDSTAITLLGGEVKTLVRDGLPKLRIDKGQTIFLRGGTVLSPPNSSGVLPSDDSDSPRSAEIQQLQASVNKLRDSGMLQTSMIPLDFFGIESADGQTSLVPQPDNVDAHLVSDAFGGSKWNQWVESREQARQTTMAAALKASGLSVPVDGLTELYRHGTFFACEPYGTCWEPEQEPAAQTSETKGISQSAQAPATNAANGTVFQPQTVQWQESDWSGWACDFSSGSRTVTRVAHTPEELQNLLRLKANANSGAYFPGLADESCYNHRWLFRHGRYVMVLPRTPPPCSGTGCKPIRPVHPPRPVFVRVGNKVGFVPSHPDDVKGKPPINLKNGIFLVPTKPGEAPQRMAWDPSQKLTYLSKLPSEMPREFSTRPIPAAPPLIRARLAWETSGRSSLSATNHAVPPITYDYKSQKFMMPAGAGAKAERVPVGGIGSNGRVETFASNQSGRYAESFGRTSAGASYSGGSSGSRSFSSGSSGGGSGGYSSHSSGGGGGSVSSASSSSAGGSSGGGRAH